MNDLKPSLNSILYIAREAATKEILSQKRELQLRKNATMQCVDTLDLVPGQITSILDELKAEAEALDRIEQIIGYEIYDLIKQSDEIINYHSHSPGRRDSLTGKR